MPEAPLTLVESAKAPHRSLVLGDEGPLPPWHSVNVIDGTAYVSISGEIGVGGNADLLLSKVAHVNKIEFVIDSQGGDSNSAWAIFDAVKNRTVESSIINGCSSCAWIVALSAKRVLISADARVMVHPACIVCYGNPEELEMHARFLRKLNLRLQDLLASRVGKETAAQLMDGNDNYLSPEQCVEIGLADEVYIPQAARTRCLPGNSPAQASTLPTEDERLFTHFLTAFGAVNVSDRAAFMRQLGEWAFRNVKEI